MPETAFGDFFGFLLFLALFLTTGPVPIVLSPLFAFGLLTGFLGGFFLAWLLNRLGLFLNIHYLMDLIGPQFFAYFKHVSVSLYKA